MALPVQNGKRPLRQGPYVELPFLDGMIDSDELILGRVDFLFCRCELDSINRYSAVVECPELVNLHHRRLVS
jgi:hypothetical protein